MKDSILSTNCLATIAELKTQTDTLDDVINETPEQTAAKSAGLLSTIASIVITPSATLAECAAKASLYLAFNRDDIAMSLAGDVVRLASG